MGATFEAYKRICSTEINIAYSAVQRFRLYMLEYAGRRFPEIADDWAQRFVEIVLSAEDRTEDYKALMGEIEESCHALLPHKRAIVLAIVVFCDHSDCDGCF